MDGKIIQLELRVHGDVVHFFNSLWHPLAAMPFLAPYIVTPTEHASCRENMFCEQIAYEMSDLQKSEGSKQECISANK